MTPLRHTAIQRSRASRPGGAACRRGALLLEVIVSAGLLTAMLAAVNQVLVRLHAQSKLVERRVAAQETLENMLEEYTIRPWDEIQTDTIAELVLPEWVQEKLPEFEVTGSVTQQADPVAAKRVTLRLSWREPTGVRRRPLSLTTWVFRPTESGP